MDRVSLGDLSSSSVDKLNKLIQMVEDDDEDHDSGSESNDDTEEELENEFESKEGSFEESD